MNELMSMSRSVPGLALAVVFMADAAPALADCADFPQPGVYWRRCVQDGQDLRGVDLSGAVIRESSFRRANLTDADLSGADARNADFVSARMHDVILDAARLVRADLTKADLAGASLREADFTRAKLFRANLRGADLTDARLEGADLLYAELGGATWIDGVTVCAEDSVGRCIPAPKKEKREVSGVGPSG